MSTADHLVDGVPGRRLVDRLAASGRGSSSSLSGCGRSRRSRSRAAAGRGRQVVERRHQLAVGEVAGGAEDHQPHGRDGARRRGDSPVPAGCRAGRARLRRSRSSRTASHAWLALAVTPLHRVAAELVAQRRDHLAAVGVAPAASGSAEERGGDHRRRHVASIASCTVQRPSPESSTQPLMLLEAPGLCERRRRPARAATSAPRCRGSRARRSAPGRARSRCLRAARSPRRRPASSRTRCRCGPS